MRLFVDLIEARFRAPFFSAAQSLSARRLVLVRLVAADGTTGYGEAAPLPAYASVSPDDVCAALERCRQPLSESDGDDHARLLAACAERARLPQALAALDLALWDLAGRRAGEPVWRLLGAAESRAVPVNATIAVPDPELASHTASEARSTGFMCIKVKVGLENDFERVAAVRAAAGAQMRIRLDANGAWSVPEALGALQVLEPLGIELCEEPTSPAARIAELAAQAPVALALDESATEPGALDRRACRAVCLKLSAWGGISGLLDAARRARATGYEVYLASTLDGPLGIAAALHAAAAIRPGLECGLATLPLFDSRPDPLPARAGRIAVAGGPGLGDGLLDWYA